MSPLLLAPIFAQTITLGVADRTEARYLVQQDDKRMEGATSPNAALSIAWRRSNLSVFYGPTLRLSPLDSSPRTLTVFHFAGLQTGYRFRHTSLSFSTGVGFGLINLRVAALQTPGGSVPNLSGDINTGGNPPPAAGQQPTTPTTPTTPTPGAGASPTTPTTPSLQQPQIIDQTVRFATWVSNANISHTLTREITMGANLGYSNTGGYGKDNQGAYARTQGWFAGVTAAHRYLLSRSDSFGTSASASRTWSDNGNSVTGLAAGESWLHRYSQRLSGDVGAGISLTRFAQNDGLVAISVFPTFSAGLNYQRTVARGGFGGNARVFSAPALDTVRATVDPRVGAGAGLTWSRDRFSTSLAAAAALSIASPGNDAGAIDSASGSFSMAYAAHDYVSLDAGLRGNVQRFKDITVIPPSYAVFLGVSLGYFATLKGK